MVLLTITGRILTAIQTCHELGLEYAVATEPAGPALSDPKLGDPISHSQILSLSKSLRKHKTLPRSIPYHLDELLRDARIYYEPPKSTIEPTSEYKALMTRLRREEESREYERMINPPLPLGTFQQRFPNSNTAKLFSASQADIGEDDETTYADINRQMALIINVLVSIVACSIAIWLAARHWSTPSRLGLSMGGSGMVGVAEVVVYAGYLRRVKEAREKGKKRIEIKEIVKTWVIGGEDQQHTSSISCAPKEPSPQVVRKRAIQPR